MPRTRDCRPRPPRPTALRRRHPHRRPTSTQRRRAHGVSRRTSPARAFSPRAAGAGTRRPVPPEDRPRLARARRCGRFLVPPAATVPASTGPHVLLRIRGALPRHRRAARRGPRPRAPLRLRTPWRRSPGRADGPDPVLRTTLPTACTASGCGAPPTARRPGRGSAPPRTGCTGSPRNSPSRRPRRRPRCSSRRRFAPSGPPPCDPAGRTGRSRSGRPAYPARGPSVHRNPRPLYRNSAHGTGDVPLLGWHRDRQFPGRGAGAGRRPLRPSRP